MQHEISELDNILTVEQATATLDRCICGGSGYWRLDVAPGHPLFGKAIPCICRRDELARKRAESLRAKSGIPDDRLRSWTFVTFDPLKSRPAGPGEKRNCIEGMRDVLKACKRYAKELDGWLILTGQVGSGKTHLAYAIAAEALARGVPVYAATTPDMLEMLRASYGNDTFDRTFQHLRDVSLLVLDDLGTQSQTPWAVEKLYQIINHRYVNRTPMVVTSNVPLSQLTGHVDGRIASRLLEGTRTQGGWARELTLPAGDFRPEAKGER